jgi:hypothetical protein
MEKNILLEKQKKNAQKFLLLKKLLSLSNMKCLKSIIINKNNTKRKVRNPIIDLVRIIKYVCYYYSSCFNLWKHI